MLKIDKYCKVNERLFVDMDGVLVDFESGINRLSNKTYKLYYPKPKNAPGVYSLMEPIPGAIEAIIRLQDLYDIYILSTAPWNNPSAWSDKLNWVKMYLGEPFTKRLILTHHKELLAHGDAYLIDDADTHGASAFGDRWIHFGTPEYPDWNAVESYLNSVK